MSANHISEICKIANIATNVAMSAEPVGTQAHHFVYAFAGEDEAASFIRKNGSDADRTQLPETLRRWQALRPRVRKMLLSEKGFADSIRIDDVPPEFQDLIQGVVDENWFSRSYAGQSVRFGIVEVDKLVAPQRSVNIEYCEQLQRSWPSTMALPDLLGICFGKKETFAPVHHLETGRNVHVFSSANADVRLLQTYVKAIEPGDIDIDCGGMPLQALITIVGSGAPVMHAFKIGKRLVLNNGFHRVFALRKLGFTQIPMLISQIEDVRLEVPDFLIGLPREYLAFEPRPVLMKDFFEPEFSVEVHVRKRQRVIQVNSAANVFDVPI